MPTAASNGLRRVAARLAPDTATDGELLARFVNDRDDDAFAALVRRHAAMVSGTCRRVLGNAPDADDAFQAAFVVLVRKAHALADRACVGNFLYGVAFNTARKAKAMALKRRSKEANATRPEPPPDRDEVLAALDEELARLPEKYRGPVVACELEGRSRRAAAEALGVPEGTISSRLATAHRMLERRLRSRGFAGVCAAALLTRQVGAATDALAGTALRAVRGPTPTVLHLATEVTKMLLLHKIGLGAAALAVLLVGAAAALPPTPTPVPDAPPRAAPEPRFVAAPVPVVPEPTWKAEFRKAYGLKDGEVIRRVAPPYPECRAEYFKDQTREWFKRNKIDPPAAQLDRDYSDHFTKFGWKDGWPVDALIAQTTPVKPDAGVALGRVLHLTTGFNHTRVEGAAELLDRKVTGDFVVRAGADPERVAAALAKILRKECDLGVALAVVGAEHDVYVLSGKYETKPLTDRKKGEIEVYGFELTERATGGGGSGSLVEMAAHVEGFISARIAVGKIEGAPKRVEWHFNYRSPFTDAERAQDTDPESVLKNIAAQTGLTVKREKQMIDVLTAKKAE